MCALHPPAACGPPRSADRPADREGLPIRVKAAVTFVEIESFSENTATFKATVDVRLRWQDPRLRRPAAEATDPPRVLRGAEAQAQLATLWVPNAEITNQRGSPSYTTLGLRIYPDGEVELTRRTTAEFAAAYEVERFPFDRQRLQIELAIRDQTADVVALGFDQRDLDSSRAAAARLGLEIGTSDDEPRANPWPGWYGASHARASSPRLKSRACPPRSSPRSSSRCSPRC